MTTYAMRCADRDFARRYPSRGERAVGYALEYLGDPSAPWCAASEVRRAESEGAQAVALAVAADLEQVLDLHAGELRGWAADYAEALTKDLAAVEASFPNSQRAHV